MSLDVQNESLFETEIFRRVPAGIVSGNRVLLPRERGLREYK